MIVLAQNQADNLVNYVESNLNKKACDHSYKHSLKWAKKNKINKNDFIDVLEENGCFCDCEVIMNLPEECDIKLEQSNTIEDNLNHFKIPETFELNPEQTYTKAVFSTKKNKQNNYTKDNELLIPAPYGVKTKKRVRRSVHFFIGLKTEMPTELGILREISPIKPKEFSKKVKDSGFKLAENFNERAAGFYLSRLQNVEVGKPIGTHFMEGNGLGGKDFELRIHKVILFNKKK